MYAITTSDINSNKYFTITATDFEALSGGLSTSETIIFRADISDNVGNFITGTASSAITFDESVPTITSITPSWATGTDQILNYADDNSDGTVTVVTSGVEDGQTVTLTLNGVSLNER